VSDLKEVERINKEAAALMEAVAGTKAKYGRLLVAAMSSIPWVGGLMGALAALHAEEEQGRVNEFHRAWIVEHEAKVRRLAEALQGIVERVEQLGEQAKQKLQDEKYLQLVGRGFRVFDEAPSDEKREYVRRLLTNAAGTPLCGDEVVRIFLGWIEQYSDQHFAVIRAVYGRPGITRLGIWKSIGGSVPTPRENSPEADLFRMLIHDLSTGRVIRQHREVDRHGNFLKKSSTREGPRRPASPFMTSSFEDEEPYELSELGGQFVHYVLNDTVRRIA
jgi:hypothetical protein